MLLNLFVFATLLLCSVEFGSCIKCYVCNSKGPSPCSDPFDRSNGSSTLRECLGRPGELPALMEVVIQKLDVTLQPNEESTTDRVQPSFICQKIVAIVDGDLMTSRGCAPTHVDGMPSCEAVAMSAPRLQLKHCTTCSTDACNTAPTTDVATSLLLRAVFVISTKLIRF